MAESKLNLQAKRIRLLFVADRIPLELRRVGEFLNEQMDPVEVLAIELRQFKSKELKTIVPTVYGQTQEASKKRAGTGQHWDWHSLFERLKSQVGPKELQLAKLIYEWMRKDGKREVVFGTGKDSGSVRPVFKIAGVAVNPVLVFSDGKLWFQFGYLENKPVFGSIEARRTLMQKFNAIKGINFTDADLTKYPGVPLTTIAADPEGEAKIIDALKWMEQQIEHTGAA